MQRKKVIMRKAVSLSSAVNPTIPFSDEAPILLPNEALDLIEDNVEFAEDYLNNRFEENEDN